MGIGRRRPAINDPKWEVCCGCHMWSIKDSYVDKLEKENKKLKEQLKEKDV